jgi:uncharacterized membrane protein YccC
MRPAPELVAVLVGALIGLAFTFVLLRVVGVL